jgi:hypothetical protein
VTSNQSEHRYHFVTEFPRLLYESGGTTFWGWLKAASYEWHYVRHFPQPVTQGSNWFANRPLLWPNQAVRGAAALRVVRGTLEILATRKADWAEHAV